MTIGSNLGCNARITIFWAQSTWRRKSIDLCTLVDELPLVNIIRRFNDSRINLSRWSIRRLDISRKKSISVKRLEASLFEHLTEEEPEVESFFSLDKLITDRALSLDTRRLKWSRRSIAVDQYPLMTFVYTTSTYIIERFNAERRTVRKDLMILAFHLEECQQANRVAMRSEKDPFAVFFSRWLVLRSNRNDEEKMQNEKIR